MSHLVEEPITSFQELPKGVVDELYDNFNNVRFYLTNDPDIDESNTDWYLSTYQEPFQYVETTVYQPGFGTFETKVPLHYLYTVFLKEDNARGRRAKVLKVVRQYQKE